MELSSSRYREIDDRSGYLGNLVMDKTMPGPGQMVQVVGAGTPADKAGIKVGDVIQEINGKPVTSFSSLENENSLAEKLRTWAIRGRKQRHFGTYQARANY